MGRMRPMKIRITARTMPMGVHKRIASDINGVGLHTSLPSWKISGFKYSFFGTASTGSSLGTI